MKHNLLWCSVLSLSACGLKGHVASPDARSQEESSIEESPRTHIEKRASASKSMFAKIDQVSLELDSSDSNRRDTVASDSGNSVVAGGDSNPKKWVFDMPSVCNESTSMRCFACCEEFFDAGTEELNRCIAVCSYADKELLVEY